MNKFTIATAAGVCLAVLGINSQPTFAAIFPIGINGFSGDETLVDYGTIQTFEPVHGETFGGVLHEFTVNGLPSLDAIIDSGPGDTNNIAVANIEGTTAGVLSLIFPNPQNRLGYGFAVNDFFDFVPNATTVELFDANDFSLGSLSADGTPDPEFAGGFLGVESTTPFVRAEVTFNDSRFAFDNLRYESVSQNVPEPTTLLGLATVLGCGTLLKRGNSKKQNKSLTGWGRECDR